MVLHSLSDLLPLHWSPDRAVFPINAWLAGLLITPFAPALRCKEHLAGCIGQGRAKACNANAGRAQDISKGVDPLPLARKHVPHFSSSLTSPKVGTHHLVYSPSWNHFLYPSLLTPGHPSPPLNFSWKPQYRS